MDYEHSFVQAVRANPADDTARLIFADYLEDLGDMRCELIRVQVAISSLEPGHPARRSLELRESELLGEYADQWIAPLKALGAEGISARCFQRGLIERVRLSGEAFLRHGDELCRECPALYCVELRQAASALEALTVRYLPRQITSLDLRSNRLEAAQLQLIARAGWNRRLISLNLSLNGLDDSALQAFADVDWPALCDLNLSVNRIGPSGLESLARRPATPALRTLILNGNRFGNDGLAILAHSPLAFLLWDLDLGSTGVTAVGVRALAGSPLLEHLTNLVLRGNPLGENAALALGALEGASQLKRLDIRGTLPTMAHYGYGSVKAAVPESLRERLGAGLLS